MSAPFAPAVPLHGYQQRWFLDRSRFKIGKFARQTGKTFTTTLEIVDDVLEGVTQGLRNNWLILSRGERQAGEAMNEGIKVHSKAYQLGFEAEEFDFKSEAGFNYRALEVTYPNGAKVTALPANPDTARGYSRNVFLDEFAFHAKSREIWGALFPVVSKTGLKLRVTSTPNGKGNKFYELMTAKDEVWSRHIVDIYQAVKDGLDRDVAMLRAGLADDELWQQEYELHWLDEASAWLPYELIMSCEHPHAGDPDRYAGGMVVIGNDIAARRDLWVAWVMELVGDVWWVREIRTGKRLSFAEQDAIMDELVRKYRVLRLAMDQTGMGEKPVEDAKARYGSNRVEGVLFSAARKLDLATCGKQLFEDGKIRIPQGDISLRADLHKVQKVIGPTGAARLVADRDGEGHADRAWAMFLAAGAAMQPSVPIEFQSSGIIRPSAEAVAEFGVGHNGGPRLDDFLGA